MGRSRNFLWNCLLRGLVICSLPILAAESPFILQEGVVIDPIDQKVFLMTPDGGIEARSMLDGTVAWRSKLAAKPVGVVDGRLYAQTEGTERGDSLELISFTLTENGTNTIFRLPLGQERWKGITHGMGEHLDVRVGTDKNRPVVWWASSVKVPRGAALAVPQESFHRASLVLDVQTGGVQPETLPPAPEYKMKAVPVASRMSQQTGQQFLSNDGRHVLVSQRVNAYTSLDRYSWTLFTTNGSKVGSHRDRFSTADFFVNGSVLIYISRPFVLRQNGTLKAFDKMVRAVDLSQSTLLWESPLRDITYQGPLPP